MSTLRNDDGCNGDGADAADALFDRGAFLRKLREMEALDEEERRLADEEEESSCSSSSLSGAETDTLYYPKYLAKQKYHDDYKHINYKYIDFGYIEQQQQQQYQDENNNTNNEQESEEEEEVAPKKLPTLMIEQDRALGKGGMVWDAGVILAEHILHEKPEWQSISASRITNMVELGTGTGVTGLMVAQALPQEVQVGLTDLPLLMPLLEKNLAHNNHPPNANHFVLEWGGAVSGSYDVILGADVVAGIYDAAGLAKTIFELCHDKTMVYISINKRFQEPIQEFQTAMTKFFEYIEIRPAMSRNKNPNVSILVATGKRSNQ